MSTVVSKFCSMDHNETGITRCKKCPPCRRFIAKKAVEKERLTLRSYIPEMEKIGKRYFFPPAPIFDTATRLMMSEVILLGFCDQGYAYIKKEVETMDEVKTFHFFKRQLQLFYCSSKVIEPGLRYFDDVDFDYLMLGQYIIFEWREGQFLRTQVISLDKEKGHLIILTDVDSGNCYQANMTQLYRVTEQFFGHPFLVTKCIPFGLEDFIGTDAILAASSSASLWRNEIVDVTFIRNSLGKTPPIVALRLKNGQCQELLNTMIMKDITTFSPIRRHQQCLSIDKEKAIITITGGKIVRLEHDHLYYHYPSGVSDFLDNLKLSPHAKLNDDIDSLSKGQLQVAFDPRERKWRRVRILDFHPEKKDIVICAFEDFGYIKPISRMKIKPLKSFHHCASKIPAQCVLFNAHPDEKTVKRFEYAENDKGATYSFEYILRVHPFHLCPRGIPLAEVEIVCKKNKEKPDSNNNIYYTWKKNDDEDDNEKIKFFANFGRDY